MTANLGIGMPMSVTKYLSPETEASCQLQTENGLLGLGGFPKPGSQDPDLINAGKLRRSFHVLRHVFRVSVSRKGNGDHPAGSIFFWLRGKLCHDTRVSKSERNKDHIPRHDDDRIGTLSIMNACT